MTAPPAVAVVYLPELMDPILVDPEVPFDEQVPELYRERVRLAMRPVIRAVVRFEAGVPDDVQAQCLFDFERQLRVLSGGDVRVFKDRMADDSKLRVVTDMRRAAPDQRRAGK